MSDTCGVEKCNDKKIKKWRARASHGRRYPLTSQAAIVHCAEYLGHLASRIFTLFMPFLLISSIVSILCLLILKKILFKSFDFIKTTQNLHYLY